jgi:hypothetical protein
VRRRMPVSRGDGCYRVSRCVVGIALDCLAGWLADPEYVVRSGAAAPRYGGRAAVFVSGRLLNAARGRAKPPGMSHANQGGSPALVGCSPLKPPRTCAGSVWRNDGAVN